MDLNLRRLRYFLAVAEHGNFGRAAEAVFLSKTALSEQIRLLEQEWGLKLFERNPRGADLTDDGRALVEDTRLLLTHAQGLAAAVGRRRSGTESVFRLGFGALAAGEGTARLIDIIKSARPNVDLRLTHLSYARQVHAVLDGEVDASIARGPIDPTPGLVLSELGTEPRMAMVAATHPLAGRSSVRVADLRAERRVTTNGVPERWRKWWCLDPGPDGAPPPYGPLIHSWEEQIEAAACSLAMSIVPATAARTYSRADVAFIPICDAEPCAVVMCTRVADTPAWMADVISRSRVAWKHLWAGA